ncbi:hypothetical protein PLESTB_001076100 [Pleodorina starrii]|uniref:Uncharacterized protein n=1 Tax=Pleodorina starrii TaxID=330485 RepID=A0A9W6BPR1_9CHLO|nr:hypothetical protein PLESTB_001076100 [Pleodorina starrii]
MAREEELVLLRVRAGVQGRSSLVVIALHLSCGRTENEQLEQQLATVAEKVGKGQGRDGVLEGLQFALRKARVERDAEMREADRLFNQLQEAKAAAMEANDLRAAFSAALSSLRDDWSAVPLLTEEARELRARADAAAQDPTNLGHKDMTALLRGLLALAARGSELQHEAEALRGENDALQQALEAAHQQLGEQAEVLCQELGSGGDIGGRARRSGAGAGQQGQQQMAELRGQVSELEAKLTEYRSYLEDNQAEIEGLQSELSRLRGCQGEAGQEADVQSITVHLSTGSRGPQRYGPAVGRSGLAISGGGAAAAHPSDPFAWRRQKEQAPPRPLQVAGTPTRHVPSSSSPISTVNYGASPHMAVGSPTRGSPVSQRAAADIQLKVAELQELALRAQQQAADREAELLRQHEAQLAALRQQLAREKEAALAELTAQLEKRHASALVAAQAREACLARQHSRRVSELEAHAARLSAQHAETLEELHEQMARMAGQQAAALGEREAQAAASAAQRLQEREAELACLHAEAQGRLAAQAEARLTGALAEQAAQLAEAHAREVREAEERTVLRYEQRLREQEEALSLRFAEAAARREAEVRRKHAERLAEQAAQLARLHAEQAAQLGMQHASAISGREAQLLDQFERQMVEREGQLANAHADQLRDIEARYAAAIAEAADAREANLQAHFADRLAEALRQQQDSLAAEAEARLARERVAMRGEVARLAHAQELAVAARELEEDARRREGELAAQLEEQRQRVEMLERQILRVQITIGDSGARGEDAVDALEGGGAGADAASDGTDGEGSEHRCGGAAADGKGEQLTQYAQELGAVFHEAERRRQEAVAEVERQYVDVVSRLGREHEKAVVEARTAHELREANLRQALERQAQEARDAERRHTEHLHILQEQLADLRKLLVQEREKYESSSAALERRAGQLAVELEAARRRETELQCDLDAARRRESESQRDLDVARRRESELQRDVDVARRRESELQRDLGAAQWRESEWQRELDAARERETELQRDVDAAQWRETELQRVLASRRADSPVRDRPQLSPESSREARARASAPGSLHLGGAAQPAGSGSPPRQRSADAWPDGQALMWPNSAAAAAIAVTISRGSTASGGVAAGGASRAGSPRQTSPVTSPPASPKSRTVSRATSPPRPPPQQQQQPGREDVGRRSDQDLAASLVRVLRGLESVDVGGTGARMWDSSIELDSRTAPRQGLLGAGGAADAAAAQPAAKGHTVGAARAAAAALLVSGRGREDGPGSGGKAQRGVERWGEHVGAPQRPAATAQRLSGGAAMTAAPGGVGYISEAATTVSTDTEYNSETEFYVDDEDDEEHRGRALAAALATSPRGRASAAAAPPPRPLHLRSPEGLQGQQPAKRDSATAAMLPQRQVPGRSAGGKGPSMAAGPAAGREGLFAGEYEDDDDDELGGLEASPSATAAELPLPTLRLMGDSQCGRRVKSAAAVTRVVREAPPVDVDTKPASSRRSGGGGAGADGETGGAVDLGDFEISLRAAFPALDARLLAQHIAAAAAAAAGAHTKGDRDGGGGGVHSSPARGPATFVNTLSAAQSDPLRLVPEMLEQLQHRRRVQSAAAVMRTPSAPPPAPQFTFAEPQPSGPAWDGTPIGGGSPRSVPAAERGGGSSSRPDKTPQKPNNLTASFDFSTAGPARSPSAAAAAAPPSPERRASGSPPRRPRISSAGSGTHGDVSQDVSGEGGGGLGSPQAGRPRSPSRGDGSGSSSPAGGAPRLPPLSPRTSPTGQDGRPTLRAWVDMTDGGSANTAGLHAGGGGGGGDVVSREPAAGASAGGSPSGARGAGGARAWSPGAARASVGVTPLMMPNPLYDEGGELSPPWSTADWSAGPSPQERGPVEGGTSLPPTPESESDDSQSNGVSGQERPDGHPDGEARRISERGMSRGAWNALYDLPYEPSQPEWDRDGNRAPAHDRTDSSGSGSSSSGGGGRHPLQRAVVEQREGETEEISAMERELEDADEGEEGQKQGGEDPDDDVRSLLAAGATMSSAELRRRQRRRMADAPAAAEPTDHPIDLLRQGWEFSGGVASPISPRSTPRQGSPLEQVAEDPRVTSPPPSQQQQQLPQELLPLHALQRGRSSPSGPRRGVVSCFSPRAVPASPLRTRSASAVTPGSPRIPKLQTAPSDEDQSAAAHGAPRALSVYMGSPPAAAAESGPLLSPLEARQRSRTLVGRARSRVAELEGQCRALAASYHHPADTDDTTDGASVAADGAAAAAPDRRWRHGDDESAESVAAATGGRELVLATTAPPPPPQAAPAEVADALKDLSGDLSELESLHRLAVRTAARGHDGNGSLSQESRPAVLLLAGLAGGAVAAAAAAAAAAQRPNASPAPPTEPLPPPEAAADSRLGTQQREQPPGGPSPVAPAVEAWPSGALPQAAEAAAAALSSPALAAAAAQYGGGGTPAILAALRAAAPSPGLLPQPGGSSPSLDLVALLQMSVQAQVSEQLGVLGARIADLQRQNQALLAASVASTPATPLAAPMWHGGPAGGGAAAAATTPFPATPLTAAGAGAAGGGAEAAVSWGGGGVEGLWGQAGHGSGAIARSPWEAWPALAWEGTPPPTAAAVDSRGSQGGHSSLSFAPSTSSLAASAAAASSLSSFPSATTPVQSGLLPTALAELLAGPYSPEELSQLPPAVQLFAPPQLRAAALAAVREQSQGQGHRRSL